jgi:uncharacterized SAM-binding protein YcdF (DUF218 family)
MNTLEQQIYSFLDVGRSPQSADCIFVLAGKQDRKIVGVKMWHSGYATQLILSIDRFEWRKFKDLGLGLDGGLESLVAQTPPRQRHFFVHMNCERSVCTLVHKGYFGTHSEALALQKYLRELPVRSLLVVSSPLHMRRVALSFRRAFRKSDIHLRFVAVQEKPGIDTCEASTALWTEFRKYLIYKFLFL